MYKLFDNTLDMSGNKTTIRRLSNILNLQITNKIQNKLIGIHAYKFGKLMCDTNYEYIIILGGTDLNIDIHDNEKRKIMKKALLNSKYIVAFNCYMEEIVLEKFNIEKSKIKIIFQSIPNDINFKKYDIRSKLCIDKSKKIYLIIGNLRKVKDPLYLSNLFYENQNKYCLILIGKILSGSYNFRHNIYHINGLDRNEINSCLKQADGIINTSISEGMPIALIEAMKIGTPVYARKNDGNLSIIKHGFNGYIFSTPEEFLNLITLPIENIIKNGYKYVDNYHCTSVEKQKYLSLIVK